VFYIYDLILIRQASFGNYVQVKNGYWDKATEELSRLSADDLERAAKEFTDGKKISNPAIYSLITNDCGGAGIELLIKLYGDGRFGCTSSCLPETRRRKWKPRDYCTYR
jgi:hypothetical protein